MLFQSWEYLFLLILSMMSISLVRNKTFNKIAILITSVFFYAYGSGWQTILFLSVIFLAYIEGLIFSKSKNKFLFTVMLVSLFLPLFIYKYLPFLMTEFFKIDITNSFENFVLPIGISFYTFQAAGYIIDVYKNKEEAEKNLLTFACFISFFPQLVAGPIERSGNLMNQIKNFHRPSKENLSLGFRYIVLGLSLKLLVAETMAAFVDPIYNDLQNRGGLAVVIATFLFGIQIYCDFNGYTQIAIGSAKLMGINLMNNFNHPYKAYSIADFWKRWHISLTTWFTDYLYIPLGGNRKGKFRTYVNTIITFLVSGFWHGADWTFVIWGLVNGTGMSIEKSFIRKPLKNKTLAVTYYIFVFFIINMFWVLFRANNIQDAINAYRLVFTDTIPQLLSLNSVGNIMSFAIRENGWSKTLFLPLFLSFIIYVWYEYGNIWHKGLESCLNSKKISIRWSTYIVLILLTLYFGKTLEQSSFVYFRF